LIRIRNESDTEISFVKFLTQFLSNFVEKSPNSTFKRTSRLEDRCKRKLILMLKIFYSTDFKWIFEFEKCFKWKTKNLMFIMQECKVKETILCEGEREKPFSSLERSETYRSYEKVELIGISKKNMDKEKEIVGKDTISFRRMNFNENKQSFDDYLSHYETEFEGRIIVRVILQRLLIGMKLFKKNQTVIMNEEFENCLIKIMISEFHSNSFLSWGNRLTVLIFNWKESSYQILVDSKYEVKK
jgi:hypothetical protein